MNTSVEATTIVGMSTSAVLLMFGVILVNGIKIVMESKPDDRVVTIVAVSIAVGVGFNAFPEALAQFPLWMSMFLCGLLGTAFVGVILSLVLPGRSTSASWDDEVAEAEAELVRKEDELLTE